MGKKREKAPYILYVCAGSSCSRHKSGKIRKRLKELIEERGLDSVVCVKKAECMKRCGKGPIVKVQPGGAVFESVRAKQSAELLETALGSKGGPSGP